MSELAEVLSEFTGAVEEKVTQLADFRRDLIRVVDDRRHSPLTDVTPDQKVYNEIFTQWLRDPDGNALLLKDCVASLSKKDITIASSIGGGYAVPKQLAAQIDQIAYTLNPWLDPAILGAVEVQTTDYHGPLGISDQASNRVTESASRTQTGVGTLRDRVPTWGEYEGFVKVSAWAMQDIPNLIEFLTNEIGAQIGAQLAGDIVSGTGSAGQVAGVLNTTPVTTIDAASPLRNANALQYVAIAGANLLLSDVEALLGNFAEGYLLDPSFAFVMRPKTWFTVLSAGRTGVAGPVDAAFTMPANPTLYGKPVRFSTAVPAVAGGAHAILAGAWRRAYLLVSRTALLSLDNVTVPGYTLYRYRIRYGGCIRSNNAAKTQRT